MLLGLYTFYTQIEGTKLGTNTQNIFKKTKEEKKKSFFSCVVFMVKNFTLRIRTGFLGVYIMIRKVYEDDNIMYYMHNTCIPIYLDVNSTKHLLFPSLYLSPRIPENYVWLDIE